jgi:hypothetical protein
MSKKLNKLISFIKLLKPKPVQKSMGKSLHKADDDPNRQKSMGKSTSYKPI